MAGSNWTRGVNDQVAAISRTHIGRKGEEHQTLSGVMRGLCSSFCCWLSSSSACSRGRFEQTNVLLGVFEAVGGGISRFEAKFRTKFRTFLQESTFGRVLHGFCVMVLVFRGGKCRTSATVTALGLILVSRTPLPVCLVLCYPDLIAQTRKHHHPQSLFFRKEPEPPVLLVDFFCGTLAVRVSLPKRKTHPAPCPTVKRL